MIDSRQHVIGKYIPYAFETITVAATAIGLTTSTTYLNSTPKPKKVFITVESAQLRYRIDGVADPTSTVGHVMVPTQSLTLEGYSQLNNFKAIRTGSTSATLQVTYLR